MQQKNSFPQISVNLNQLVQHNFSVVISINSCKNRKKPVYVTVIGEDTFRFRVFDLRPSCFPVHGKTIAGIGHGQRGFSHIAEQVRLSPGIPGVFVERGADGGDFVPAGWCESDTSTSRSDKWGIHR